jgi:predicted secreted protein
VTTVVKSEVLRRVLRDERSGRVVFVSHCLLNQNVRYFGGATCPGAVNEVVAALQRDRVGIVQMPCPEQHAWGGVDKRYTMPVYGADRTYLRRLRRPATWVFLLYTRMAYRRLAGRVGREIGDYLRSGHTVRAVIGVGGSPSCGVRTSLDLRAALDVIADADPTTLSSSVFNRDVIAAHARTGEGMFTAALRRHLHRRGIDVVFDEHESIAEITGRTASEA